MTPQTFSCCETDHVEVIFLFVFWLDFPSYKCKIWVWITVGLCFVLQKITRTNNRASFYSDFALNIKASCFMPVIPQIRSKMPVFLVVVVYLFSSYYYYLFIYFIFFWGGGAFLFCFCCCCYDTTLNLPSIMNKPIKLATPVNNFHNSLHCLF